MFRPGAYLNRTGEFSNWLRSERTPQFSKIFRRIFVIRAVSIIWDLSLYSQSM